MYDAHISTVIGSSSGIFPGLTLILRPKLGVSLIAHAPPLIAHRSQTSNLVLNTIYKLIAKALANRSKPLCHYGLDHLKLDLLKEDIFLENIFIVQKAMYWATTSQQNLAIILLDFEKVYDRISWVFLDSILIHIGFSLLWVSWIRALHVDASTQILVNGQKGKLFPLERSFRQGCLRASYLFFFVADVLGYILKDEKYGVENLKL